MSELRSAVERALSRPEVIEAVGALYARVQREVESRRPLCQISGRCCRFEEYGHRLYVTTIELAAFLRGLRDSKADVEPPDRTGCPFQINRLCSVHAIRPFGCRMFFCDATSTQWQNALYERFHTELKGLHETLGVPYVYVEWRQALRELAPDPHNPGAVAG